MPARVTQYAVESLIQLTANARVTQFAIESLVQLSANARVTQFCIEALVTQSPAELITQEGIEIVAQTTSRGRVTQFGTEIVAATQSAGRITQFGLEIVSNPRIRWILSHAQFRATITAGRNIPAHVVFTDSYKHIPATAKFATTNGFRSILSCTAELGSNRRVIAHAVFQGKSSRAIASFARFKNPGNIPCYASFWKPLHDWNVYSDALTKAYSLATHAMGGFLASFVGFAEAHNALPPLGWELNTYDDSFWPFGYQTFGLPIPIPSGDANVKFHDFNS